MGDQRPGNLPIRQAVPHLEMQGGSIVVVASVNGTRMFSNSGATAYASSKAAQVAMSKMLAVELGQFRARVNAVFLGATETEISDHTKERDVESVKLPVELTEGSIPLTGKAPGKLISFLVSDCACHISGSEIYMDGAQSLLQGNQEVY